MANIVAATIRLLETKSPKDVTLRDVALESGHGPRLIIEWFGGKGGLYSAVFEKIFKDLTESGELFYADVAIRNETKIAFQVFNYMQINHPDVVESMRKDFLVARAVKERLQTVRGLSEKQADLTARRLAVLSLGVGLFREFVDLSDDEVVKMMQDEFKATTGFTFPDNPDRS